MESSKCSEFVWYDIKMFGVEGKGWPAVKSFYDRLPARAEGLLPDVVWDLSRSATGMSTSFETKATEIRVRWRLRHEILASAYMSAIACSGLDLYSQDSGGCWRWAGVTRNGILYPVAEDCLLEGIPEAARKYRLYLPLINPVDSVEIGLPRRAAVVPLPPRREKPVVFYGTSILNGCAASRPGMVHSSILQRRLNIPVINLGFSGNARMELPLAGLLAELDAAVYVLDALPNMEAALINERAEPFIRRLRELKPAVPLVLVEDRTYGNAWIKPSLRESNDSRRAVFRKVYDRLVCSGMTGLSYVEGEQLLGDDDEGTVDSSHPNDLGFQRMADALTPILRILTAK